MGKKSELSRKRIIEAGIKSIAERGVEKVSLNGIIKDADVSKGGFYYHFRNMDDLLDGIFHHIIEYFFKGFEMEYDGDRGEFLKKTGREAIERSLAEPELSSLFFLFIGKCFTDSALREKLVALRSDLIGGNGTLAKLFSDTNGGFGPEELVALFDILVVGFVAQSRFVADRRELFSLWDRLVDKIIS